MSKRDIVIVAGVGVGALALMSMLSGGGEEEYPFSGSQYFQMPQLSIPTIEFPDMSGIFTGVSDVISSVSGGTVGIVSATSEGVGGVITSVSDNIREISDTFTSNIATIAKVPEKMPSTIENIWKAIFFPFYEAHRAGGEAGRLTISVTDAVKKAGEDLGKSMRNAVQATEIRTGTRTVSAPSITTAPIKRASTIRSITPDKYTKSVLDMLGKPYLKLPPPTG